MLIARLPDDAALGLADATDPHRPPRIVAGAFAAGDRWYVTGDLFRVDTEGDHWFVDRAPHLILTRFGAVASTRIEDALYDAGGIALCIAGSRRDPDDLEHAIAAVQLAGIGAPDLDALTRAVLTLPEFARPRRLRLVDLLPMSDGYRPIKRTLDHLDFSDGPAVLAWDPLAQRYRTTATPS
jgi:acyl-coenzyme A synthetase/AMP-(fatty) acid ligase